MTGNKSTVWLERHESFGISRDWEARRSNSSEGRLGYNRTLEYSYGLNKHPPSVDAVKS
jgi:hypothetical protein